MRREKTPGKARQEDLQADSASQTAWEPIPEQLQE